MDSDNTDTCFPSQVAQVIRGMFRLRFHDLFRVRPDDPGLDADSPLRCLLTGTMAVGSGVVEAA